MCRRRASFLSGAFEVRRNIKPSFGPSNFEGRHSCGLESHGPSIDYMHARVEVLAGLLDREDEHGGRRRRVLLM